MAPEENCIFNMIKIKIGLALWVSSFIEKKELDMQQRNFKNAFKVVLALGVVLLLSFGFTAKSQADTITLEVSEDSWLNSCPGGGIHPHGDPDVNGWKGCEVRVRSYYMYGVYEGSRNFRPLLNFDLSNIPDDQTITSAILRLRFMNAPSYTVGRWYGVYRVIDPNADGDWIESQASFPGRKTIAEWDTKQRNVVNVYPMTDFPSQYIPDPSVPWEINRPDEQNHVSGGGDFIGQNEAMEPYASEQVPQASAGDYMEWDVTELVQEWYDGTYENLGLLIKDSYEMWYQGTWSPAWGDWGESYMTFFDSRHADSQVCINGGYGAMQPPVLEVTYSAGDDYILNLNQFPWYEADNPAEQYSGAAVAKMWLSYLWWDNTVHSEPPEYSETQQWLYDYGHSENYDCNTGLQRLDTQGLWHTIQTLDPAWDPYHYNFGIHNEDTVEEGLDVICHWIAYPAGGGSANPNGFGVDGYPVHVPAAVTTGGNYDNWMAIRGIRTSENPWETDDYDVIGFWVNNPVPSGDIGVNTYKTAQEWVDGYYDPLSVNPDDPSNGKWVSILEPPEHEAEVSIVRSKSRFAKAISALLFTEETVRVNGIEKTVITKKLNEELALDVVQAAVDGVSEELIPYDPEFEEIFNETIAGIPLFVKGKDGRDYYLVPFDTATNVSAQNIKANNINLRSATSDANTLVVVLLDASNGSFKEVSWVDAPVKYLPISLEDALVILSKRLEKERSSLAKPYLGRSIDEDTMVELVHIDASPYYPVWKIQIGSKTYFVNQQGELSIKGGSSNDKPWTKGKLLR